MLQQNNSALSPRNLTKVTSVSSELVAAGNYGQRLNAAMLQVLQQRLSHRNRDGSPYIPRIVDSMVVPYQGEPYYHVMVIDAQALWHFDLGDMLGQETLDALTGTLRRPVRAFNFPHDGGPFKGGIVYVVKFRDLPKEETRLPKVAPLDLGKRATRGKLWVPIGVSSRGDVWKPLAEMGHTLIVGSSGAGKSTWTHCALAALLPNNSPRDLRVALLDPKRNELTPWSIAPHCFGEYATTPEQAEKVLGEIVDEIDRRGERLAATLSRDIRGYNARSDSPFPYLVVVIDECLDLVLSAGPRSGVNEYLKIIAIRGRSAGIILWASTQHASAVDGLPRVVNTNLTTRLVFRVADDHAARSAGCPGAHTIPASIPGRMLARIDDEPMLAQGYAISDDELLAVARSVSGAGQGESQTQTLTERERQIAIVVLTNHGEFNIVDVARATGAERADMIALAKEWEGRGWLTPVQRTQRGNRPRQATDALIALVEEPNGASV